MICCKRMSRTLERTVFVRTRDWLVSMIGHPVSSSDTMVGGLNIGFTSAKKIRRD